MVDMDSSAAKRPLPGLIMATAISSIRSLIYTSIGNVDRR
jgi:hypothetical protein